MEQGWRGSQGADRAAPPVSGGKSCPMLHGHYLRAWCPQGQKLQHTPPLLSPSQKNHFPAESETFARIQELMLPRDPLAKQGPKDEEQSVPT